MEILIAILGVIASILAVVASALPLYIAYREERKKSKDENKPGQTGPVTRSEPEV